MSIYKLRTELGHYFKWVLIVVALTVVVGTFFSFAPGMNQSGREKQAQDMVLAKVSLSKGSKPIEITRGELETAWDRVSQRSQDQTVSAFALVQQRSGLFGQMVESSLWLLAAQQQGVDVTNADVDKEIDKYVVQMLNTDRNLYIGQPGKTEKRPADPRQDQNYIDALSRDGKSIGEREKFYKDRIPADQVRAGLAIQALQKKIETSVPKATDQEVTNSYNQYKVTTITVFKMPGAPTEQLKQKADGYLKQASSGADFVKLAKSANPSSGPAGDPTMTYTFEDHYKVPAQVREKVEALQPGQITPVIDTDQAYYIAKLDSVTPKPPANLDAKAKADRAKAIEQERAGAAMGDFQKKLTESRVVQIYDPEMHGYWALTEAQQMGFNDPAKAKQKMDEAVAALTHSLNSPATNKLCASSLLAQLYFMQGNYKDTALLLGNMLDGQTRLAESAELRMLLGESLSKIGKKNEAIASYEIAMRMSKYNSGNLQTLQGKFKELGRQDLVQQTASMLDEQKQREAAAKALEDAKKNPPASVPASAPKPAGGSQPAGNAKP